MTKQKINYTQSVNELETILAELESNNDIDMEQISEKVKKASELLAFCKKQLHEIDADLEKILEELD